MEAVLHPNGVLSFITPPSMHMVVVFLSLIQIPYFLHFRPLQVNIKIHLKYSFETGNR